jgi:hypothetical protein
MSNTKFSIADKNFRTEFPSHRKGLNIPENNAFGELTMMLIKSG